MPLDKFAQDLGISQDALTKQYQQSELQAQAAIKANEYLANILEVLQGKTPDHNPFTLTATDTVSGTKPVAVQISGPIALSAGSTPAVVTAPETNAAIKDLSTKFDIIIRAIGDGTIATQESARTIASAVTNGRTIQPTPIQRTVRTAVQ